MNTPCIERKIRLGSMIHGITVATDLEMHHLSIMHLAGDGSTSVDQLTFLRTLLPRRS